MTRIDRLAPVIAAGLCALSCGPVVVNKTTQAVDKPPDWRYVSEWQPIRLLAVGGGELWAVTPEGLNRTAAEGSDEWVAIEGLVEEGKKPPFLTLHADPAAELWVGGREFLAFIGSGTATRYTSIEKIIGTISVIEETGDGVTWVGGGSRLATYDRIRWRIVELPFSVSGSAVLGDALWLGAGKQGVARVVGDRISEYSEPTQAGEFEAISVAAAGEEPCVLWGGSTAHLSFLRDESWHVYAVPASAGEAMRLHDAGGTAILETSRGLFMVTTRAEDGSIPLEPLHEPIEAKAFTYRSEHEEPDEEGEPPESPPKPRTPEPLAASRGPGGELPARGLVHIRADLWSPVTAIDGDGEYVVVGTESMGTYVLRDGAVVSEVASYGVRPRTPLSKMTMSDGRFYYVLENDAKAGVVHKGTFSSEPVTGGEGGRLLAFDVRAGYGYAMSLTTDPDAVAFFSFEGTGFKKVLERPVNRAGGIGDIGAFQVMTDGSFWFTILAPGASVEAGVGVVHEDKEQIVYHGAHPEPPDMGVTFPGGVRYIETTPGGHIWLGGLEGAVRLDKDLEPTVFREPQGLVGDMVADMAKDGDDLIWALTADGLGWFEDESWHFPDSSPYRGKVISCIGVDGSGNLLLADAEAVRRKVGESWKMVIALEDLPGRRVLDVGEGANGRLWVVTDRAIAIEPAG